MSFSTFVPRSPHEAQDFAADLALARFTVGHKTLAGGQNCNTETTEYSWNFFGVAIHTKTRC